MKAIVFSGAISLVSLFSAMGDDFPAVGGPSITLRVQEREAADGAKMPITKEQVDQTILVIEKRLKSMGVVEPHIVRKGSDGIIVQLPGAKPEEADRIRAALETVAKLELRAVSPRNDEPGADGKSLAQRVQDGAEIVPGYRAFTYKFKDEEGNAVTRPILLKRRIALGGSDIAIAAPFLKLAGAVAITLNAGGTDKMIALTQNMRPGVDRIAILLDGEVISAPVVNQVPLGKQFIIEGLHKVGEAQSLANALMNPLENPLKTEEMGNVSPREK